jgi:DNA-binding CsgD family transcriptional regulator/tetratricopeptide (TPR) repeat protein
MADVLIERAAFLASLEELLAEALDGTGRLVFLGGEAGVGKTTLAATLAAAAAGTAARTDTAYPDTIRDDADTTRAGANVASAASDADAATLAVRRGSCDNVTTAEALGPILDALPELAAALDEAAGVSRLRLFRQVRDALSGSPMLLLLEDVHWADEATLDILRFLGRRLAGTRLMIVATFRSEEVGRDHPLTVVMGDLAGQPGVVRMQLPAFSLTGVRQLLTAAGSALDPDVIFQRTGGNAFYVTELIAAAAEQAPPGSERPTPRSEQAPPGSKHGSGPRPPGDEPSPSGDEPRPPGDEPSPPGDEPSPPADDQVPATVRDAVLARVSRLSPAAREVTAAASVIGRRADLDLLAAVAEQPLAAIDECLDRGVLVAAGPAVEFRHDLARLAVERSLPPAQRAAAHARALAYLTARGSHDHRWLAHHAAGCDDRAAVTHHAPLAAARAARLGAHREAAEQLQLALRHHETPDRQRAGLLEQLSYECYLTDQLTRARDSLLEALAIHEQQGDARPVGTAQRRLSRFSWVLGQNADSQRYAAAAVSTLEPLGPGPELAMAYSNVAQLHMLAGRVGETLRWGKKAIAMARELGDRETEMHALNNVGTALWMSGDAAEGQARLTQSLDLALADDAHEHAARAYTNLGATGIVNWSLPDADRHLRAGINYCADRDLDTWRLYMTAYLARSLAAQGQYAVAGRQVASVLRYPHVSPITRVSVLPVAGVLAARRGGDEGDRGNEGGRGDGSGGISALDEALAIALQTGESQRLVPVAVARAEAAWIAGRAGDVAAEIDRAWSAAVALPQAWELGELSWWLHLAGQHRPISVPLAPPFALMLADKHRNAAAAWEALGCPLWSAYALALSAEIRDAQESLDILARLDVPAVRHAVLRERHARGLAVPRGPRQASRANPAGLTARETEVLQLLADGLSYAEVADRLVLSEKTVGHHVSAVLRKLGEPTRSRAVAAAMRLGVIAPR